MSTWTFRSSINYSIYIDCKGEFGNKNQGRGFEVRVVNFPLFLLSPPLISFEFYHPYISFTNVCLYYFHVDKKKETFLCFIHSSQKSLRISLCVINQFPKEGMNPSPIGKLGSSMFETPRVWMMMGDGMKEPLSSLRENSASGEVFNYTRHDFSHRHLKESCFFAPHETKGCKRVYDVNKGVYILFIHLVWNIPATS